jgi:hypothetical protein
LDVAFHVASGEAARDDHEVDTGGRTPKAASVGQ